MEPSDSSSGGLAQARPSRAPAFVQRLAETLSSGREDYTVSSLGTAAKVLMRLRDELVEAPLLDHEDRAFCRRGLACACVALRSHQVLDDAPSLCHNTMVLIAALLGVLNQHADGSRDDEDAVSLDPAAQLAAREGLIEQLRAADAALRGAALGVGMRAALEDAADAPSARSRARALAARVDALFEPLSELVRICNVEAVLGDAAVAIATGWARLERLKLDADAWQGEFDALGADSALGDERERRVAVRGLLRAAESESGQMVLKDLLISLRAPAAVVGQRRTLLLSQATASRVAETNLDLVTQSHDTAKRGVELTYDAAADDAAGRAAAVLTALAMALAKSEPAIRRGDAFGGAVQLPFLCTRPPKSGSTVLYVEDSDAWLLLKASSKGHATVAARRHGVDGLEALAVQLARAEKERRVRAGDVRAAR
jgi:hypothetical protein